VSLTFGMSASFTWRGFGLGASILGANSLAIFGFGAGCSTGGGGSTLTFATGILGRGGAGISSGGPAISVTIYMALGIMCSGNSCGMMTTNAAKAIWITRLVPIALMRGLVLGNKENRALTGLFPTMTCHASGLGPVALVPDRSRRLPCVSCCVIVVIWSRRLSKESSERAG